ncbi:hypothetical protein B9Z19DRAFT_1118391 [Tuber borchii]|uniref:Uncharacterized protein n=1 Tax=Tuber borchii TaxID=42251 RepID=A0A2T7A8M0_TUBBO|nr:hypothetical protein B9Z19DRAFT_1118391 [Tuber borchii]
MSSIAPLNTKSRSFSSSTTSSTSAPASPTTTTTSSSSSNDSHAQKLLEKVKSFVPHHHHHQSKKPYPQPPTDVSQQPQHRTSTDSMHGVERRPTVTMYGRHSNEWLFGGVSVRKVVGGLFQHED